MNIFCNECEDKTPTKNLETIITKSGSKHALKGFCTICGCKKIMLIGKHGGDFVNFINTLIPGEKHLPGHSFTGPGTNLGKRLNDDLTPKDFSKPINRVDEAAMWHDIKYINESKEARQQADNEMIDELQNIHNPTFREKVERGIVIPILKAKKWIGLGIASLELRYLLNPVVKRCKKCKEIKHISEFSFRNDTARADCFDCYAKQKITH